MQREDTRNIQISWKSLQIFCESLGAGPLISPISNAKLNKGAPKDDENKTLTQLK